MKVLAVCGSGTGTSMILKTTMKKIVDKGIKIEIDTCTIDELSNKIEGVDLVICSDKLAPKVDTKSKKLISVKNILDDVEVLEKLNEIGLI
ncbi:PTS sugar transporter subunit IIB [Streptobacillus notomytis]|uniref:PTS sugar transporter subunit IIB n=1 Tax=Streptobacillus notomytis TaxID=1712031 RepID=UPI0009360654|nr:PTS sugar transporter subunit IIB [Streptobacillus notomytis]